MALKKAMKRPTPKTTPATTISKGTSEASNVSVKPAQRRAVPPPARKPIPPPAHKPILPTEKKAPVMEPPKPAPKKQKPMRKPVVKAPEPPKEVKPVEEAKPEVKQPEQSEVRKSPEAPKPAPAAGSDRGNTEPRRVDTTADKRFSSEAMRAMELEERYKAWKKLNRDPEKFTPLLAQLPKQMQMRKNEAVLRELVTEKPPKTKNLLVFYCPYCVDWQVYHNHSWTGYTKCTGCSMSTKDFYTAVDNGVFGKE